MADSVIINKIRTDLSNNFLGKKIVQENYFKMKLEGIAKQIEALFSIFYGIGLIFVV